MYLIGRIPLYYREHNPKFFNNISDVQKFKFHKIDTTQSIEYYYYVFSYLDEDSKVSYDTLNVLVNSNKYSKFKKSVIIDIDKDNDFRNDKVYNFDNNVRSQILYLPVGKDKNNNGNHADKEFKQIPFIEITDTSEIELFKFIANWVYHGKFKFNNTAGELFAFDRGTYDGKSMFLHFKINNKSYLGHSVGQKIAIDNILYTIDGDFNKITLKKSDEVDYSIFPSIALISQKPLVKEQFKEKYILLDFWGSWCGPCIKGIPDIRKFAEDYKDHVKVISIAFEKTDDTTKLIETIKKNDMDWNHIYFSTLEKNNDKNESKFFIRVFPTFVLIDPSGKVLIRVEGKDGIFKVEEVLKEKNLI